MDKFKGKRLLILGAGRGQIGLYKAAHELGITTIAGTMPDNDPPCISLADEVCYMNILNPDEVELKTSELQFDGVATCCLDMGLKALGRLCDLRHLPGYSENTADLCNNKLLAKKRFLECGVSTAAFKKISTIPELQTAVNEIGGYPVIIKATDLAGSMGIYKAENEQQALDGFKKAMEATRQDYIIVEQFLSGKEFGAQAFIQNGEIIFIMPHGDILFHASTDIPVGHFVPYQMSDTLSEKVYCEASKAIKAMELDNCAVNIDFIAVGNELYVLELSGRIGANGLPEVVSAFFGIDYYKMAILAALGEPVRLIWDTRKPNKATLARMIISPSQNGILKNIEYTGINYPEIFEMLLFARPGTTVHKFENSSHCLGQVIITSDTIDKCDSIAREVLDHIKIDLA